MQLFNTLTRRKEEFVPLVPNKVGLYCCGPTVYNFLHIGNLRAYIFDDTVRRTLKFNGFQVKHVMNITDVGHLESDEDDGEDKMEKGALREGMSPWEIARKYETAALEDMWRLNIERPEVICRATEHIPEMISLIERLEENASAYVTLGAVYFDTSTFKDYAELARLDLKGLVAGAGGRAELQGEKRHQSDFALWFMNKPRHIMQWDSPWGRGYPGWHIECSAMSMKYLGETIDIHCGGVDHIPVHHTNEIAQSEGATGRQFVRYWLHNEFLIIPDDKGSGAEQDDGDSGAGVKMSKSGENFLTLQRVLDRNFDPMAYRYLCLQAHYRSELQFNWETLRAAQSGLRKVYGAQPDNDTLIDDIRFTEAREEALSALNDDLNTPQLVGILNKYSSYRLWKEFDAVLGLEIEARSKRAPDKVPPEVQEVIDKRNAARKAKDWAQSDALRNELIQMGWEVADSMAGTTVKKRLL